MKTLSTLTVAPSLPGRIARLQELAYNLYWSWTPRAMQLFEGLDPLLWETSNHNPVHMLLQVSQERLEDVALDSEYLKHLDAVLHDFDHYMNNPNTWFSKEPLSLGGKVAYFSAEFAFAESLPIYSGGLGVLAGDHCKSASDLGLPFVGVGLVYHQGYFRQSLNRDGWQEETYETLNFAQLPLTPALDATGKEVRVSLHLLGRTVWVKVWHLHVGRISVYLLDTDLPENEEQDRALTARLYGGNQEMRIQQEMVLGIGGIRALRALNEPISVYHMNEGHAAFLGLERVREIMQSDPSLDFWEAVEGVASNALFTTHTPVPAGNDAFPLDIVHRYLGKWYDTLKVGYDDFMGLALHHQPWGPTYSMTVLALRLSRAANGVSELHGQVSRNMWNFLYPGSYPSEVPIGHITNGAHTLTFLAQELRDLYSTVLPADWTERIEDRDMWNALDNIPDVGLVRVLHQLKKKMIHFVRQRLKSQYLRHEAPALRIASADTVLDTHTLTIGFARRFATYKRATLLFHDLDRLKRLVNDPKHPVQFVFAGKAHPADNPGKELIQAIYRYAQDPDLVGKIVILENYDLNVARYLVQGVDIWLNNPRRPLEASGTSGMKASFNGALNFSILDGWWRESFDGTNGFSIGEEREFSNLDSQDDFDAHSLYETLEKQIVPEYYERDEHGTRVKWMARVRKAITSVAPQFSMQRQVIEYTRTYYGPLHQRSVALHSKNACLEQLSAWKIGMKKHWPQVSIEALVSPPDGPQVGKTLEVHARVYAPGIDIQHLCVEAVMESGNRTQKVRLNPLGTQGGWTEYEAKIPLTHNGEIHVGVRVFPSHPDLAHPLELGLIQWA
ncbi:MAG: alpha-glucan family phosphorylase [Deinococcaceae bacterium]